MKFNDQLLLLSYIDYIVPFSLHFFFCLLNCVTVSDVKNPFENQYHLFFFYVFFERLESQVEMYIIT